MNPQPLQALTTTRRSRPLATLMAVAAAAVLAACGAEEDSRTVGQTIDEAVSTAQTETQAAGERMAQGAQEAGAEITAAMTDARITAEVNAKLAADAELSALRIDVDTEGGHVVLDGEAPDGSARERAEALARAVDGVLSVDNRLSVTAG